jgi:hypothetical protein
MASWNEYTIRLVFENYFIQGVGYGETSDQALRLFEDSLNLEIPEPLEVEIQHTAIMEDY